LGGWGHRRHLPADDREADLIEPRPETLDALMAKFRRINYEKGHLPRVTYRLKRRSAKSRGRIGGGRKADPGMLRFPPDVWARIQNRFYAYLDSARRAGKNLSKHWNRQPYLMLAIRYELSDREERLRVYAKTKRTVNQKRYCYNILSRRAKMKMEGYGDVSQRGYDRT
jgi:hypothetical protein